MNTSVTIVTTTCLDAVLPMNYVVSFVSNQSLAPVQSQFVHIVSYAAWMGSTMWVTFVAGITMMRNLPRQTFGKIQV